MPAFPTDPAAPIPDHIKGLIFDCDGTLVDTMPLHCAAWIEAMAAINITISPEQFYSFAGMPTVTIIETLSRQQNVACDVPAAAEEKERLFVSKLAAAEPIHSVTAIVRREKGRRKMAVASGGWKDIVRQTLAVIGMDDMFDTIVGADEVEHGKPAPDIFLKAAQRLNLQPVECLVYEDGDLGIQAAIAAGMQVIDVRPWYSSSRS